jgi:hypothetical protein
MKQPLNYLIFKLFKITVIFSKRKSLKPDIKCKMYVSLTKRVNIRHNSNNSHGKLLDYF